MAEVLNPQDYLDSAVRALGDGGDFRSKLDELPVPIYVTDADGLVTYWNRACVEFAGREPQTGKDRWCVTWRLYTMAGEPMPHEDCPMAEAIKHRQPIRDEIAIAARPDGSRVAFKPYPTPLFDSSGALCGAVNMMIDVSVEQSSALSDEASRCWRLAGATYDRSTSEILTSMAERLDRTAAELRKDS